jgi:23S rRNA maturation mini-RNase III
LECGVYILSERSDKMAAKSTKLQSSLVLKYQDGVDDSGNDIIKSQRFSKIKLTASDEEIYNTALEVEKLIGKPLGEIIKVDENDITA